MDFAERIIRYELEGHVILHLQQDVTGDIEVVIGGQYVGTLCLTPGATFILEALGFPTTPSETTIEKRGAQRL